MRSVFSARWAGVVCIVLAIVNKCLIAWIYSNLETDKSLYLLMAKGFLQTGLLAEPVSLVENGATIYVYNPAANSPLYPVIAAPLLWLSSSYFITQLIVSVLGWILFFTALYKVATVIFEKPWLANLFILSTGFFLYPHELDAGPKDTLAVAFTLWSIYFSYRFIQFSPRFRTTLLLSISICLLCLTKLLYVPLIAVFLFVLFVWLIRKKSKTHWHQFGFLLLCLSVAFVAVYLCIIFPLQQLAPFYAPAITNDGTTFIRGIYPQNLLSTYPFISSSFINTNFWGVQLENIFHVSFGKVTAAFRVLDVLIFIALIAALIYHRKKPVRKIIWNIIAVAITLVACVFYLSLTYQSFSYKSSTNLWTYVADARSFLVPMIALQLFFFLLIFKLRVPVLIKNGLLLIFLFECFHGLYFTVKQTAAAGEIINNNRTNSQVKKVVAVLELRNTAENKWALLTSDNTLRRYALVNGQPAYSFTGQSSSFSWMKKGNGFMIATHLQDSALLKIFPAQKLIPADTIRPFVIHFYKAEELTATTIRLTLYSN